MSLTITLEEAQAKLPEIIANLTTDEQVLIVKDNRPIAELRSAVPAKPRPQFGACQGMLTIVADDNDHLQDFEEYMQ